MSRAWPKSDPGKRVDAHLTTAEWKRLYRLAKALGWTLRDTARWAINQSVDQEIDNNSESVK